MTADVAVAVLTARHYAKYSSSSLLLTHSTPLHSVAARLAQLLCCSSINAAAAAAALIKEWDEKDAEKEEEL